MGGPSVTSLRLSASASKNIQFAISELLSWGDQRGVFVGRVVKGLAIHLEGDN